MLTFSLILLLTFGITLTWFIQEKKIKHLTQKNENLQKVANVLQTGLYYKNINGSYKWVNDTFCAMLNSTKEQIIGKTDLEIFDEERALKHTFQEEQLLQGKEIYFEEKIASRFGTRYFASQKYLLKNDEEHPYAVVGTMQDITMQKESEIELRSQSDFVQTLINSQEQLIITTNGRKILSANSAFFEFFSVDSLEEFVNNYGACICETFSDDVPKEYLRATMDGATWIEYLTQSTLTQATHKVKIVLNEQEYIFSVTGAQLPLKDHVSAAIFTDITELEEAKEAALEAERSAKIANESKSLFLANMSHEIRTPMNAIIGFSELLHEQLEEHHLQQFTATIQSAGHTLLELINDILDISKIEAGKLDIIPTPTNPYNLIKDTANIFALKLQENDVELFIEIDKTIPHTLIIDEIRVRQILLNLIGNAVKFTKKGSISVIAKALAIDDAQSSIDLEIAIKDTGIGIKESQLERIFNSFEQQDGQSAKQYGGTGLGLSISQKLARMMGGELYVESKEGVGSTFYLLIPNISISSVVVEKESSLHEKVYHFEPSTVLIADDIENNLELVAQNLKHTPLHILKATNGQKAVDIVKEMDVDLVLMDIRMPEMDGYEAAQLIKELHPKLPIVALTASVMEHEFQDTSRKHFDGYLRKPILRSKLLHELAQFLPTHTADKDNTEEKTQLQLSKKATRNKEKIITLFAKKIAPLVTQAQKSNSMKDITTLASAIENIAQEYEIEHLLTYAKTLHESVAIFDIMEIKKLLESYEEHLSILQS